VQKAETHRNAIGLTARSLTSSAITAVRKRDLSLVQPPQCLTFCPANGDRMMGFAGMEQDTITGLNLAVHRVENPGTERWTSRDPLGFRGGDADLFRYVLNSPTSSADPRGLWAHDPAGPIRSSRQRTRRSNRDSDTGRSKLARVGTGAVVHEPLPIAGVCDLHRGVALVAQRRDPVHELVEVAELLVGSDGTDDLVPAGEATLPADRDAHIFAVALDIAARGI
jgi:RHS repeat-associated protein